MPEPAEPIALERLYSTDRSGRLQPVISAIYPRRMSSWRYLGTASSCINGGPGVGYRPFGWESDRYVALEVEVEWDAPDSVTPTALYRLYDASNALLYIGISTNPKSRFTQHSFSKPWWSSVTRTRVSWLEVTRQEALAIEAAAIRDEGPVHNGKHNSRIAPFSPDSWPVIDAPVRQKASTLANLIRAEIDSGRWQPGVRIPESEAVAAASGVSLGTTNRAYEYLKREGLLVARVGHGTFVRRPKEL